MNIYVYASRPRFIFDEDDALLILVDGKVKRN